MGRKIWSMTLMVLSTILFVASIAGVGVIWYYNTPLTEEIISRLQEIDSELTLAQSALTDAQVELERALRIVEAAEKALEALSQQTAQAQDILGSVKGTIDDKLLPGLNTSRDKVDDVRGMVEGLAERLKDQPDDADGWRRLARAYEVLGEPRRQASEQAVQRYVAFYLEHMGVEEQQILPAALLHLGADDWAALDAAFAANRDPLTGHEPDDVYRPLFSKIMMNAPVPIGLGSVS